MEVNKGQTKIVSDRCKIIKSRGFLGICVGVDSETLKFEEVANLRNQLNDWLNDERRNKGKTGGAYNYEGKASK